MRSRNSGGTEDFASDLDAFCSELELAYETPSKTNLNEPHTHGQLLPQVGYSYPRCAISDLPTISLKIEPR